MNILLAATVALSWFSGFAFMMALHRRPPCSCPVPFSAWMLGERCLRHDEATEAGRLEV